MTSGESSKRLIAAFAAGIVFAIGLGISGMTSPAKVLGFLDVTSPTWDPSLMFVMVGAIGAHVAFAQRAKKKDAANLAPLFEKRFFLPESNVITRSLLLGAVLFGVGWGIAGYCPGPGIVAIASGNKGPIVWVIAMLASMWMTRRFLIARRV